MIVSGNGYLKITNTNYLIVGTFSFNQTVTITVFGFVRGVGQVSASMQVTLAY
jgi:hypothetical protein